MATFRVPQITIRKDWFPATPEGEKLYFGLSGMVDELNKFFQLISQDRERIILENAIAEPANGLGVNTIYKDSTTGAYKIKEADDTVLTITTT